MAMSSLKQTPTRGGRNRGVGLHRMNTSLNQCSIRVRSRLRIACVDSHSSWSGRTARPRNVVPVQSTLDDECANDWLMNRRAIMVGSISLIVSTSGTVNAQVRAEDGVVGTSNRAYFDISVDGTMFGRIEIETLGNTSCKIGEQRFLDLSKEIQGVGYKRGKITQLQDSYIVGGGLTSLSYEATGETGITGGVTAEYLEDELDASTLKHDSAGLVSLNVRPMKVLESKDTIKAIDGKFVNVTQVFGQRPNGTEFYITTGPAPDLDGVNLIVGKVVRGMDVVEKLQQLPRVKNNMNSPFFQAGKTFKDRRANVAELAFDRPFSKVLIKNCGLIQ